MTVEPNEVQMSAHTFKWFDIPWGRDELEYGTGWMAYLTSSFEGSEVGGENIIVEVAPMSWGISSFTAPQNV
jgi:hypothetical protein